MPKFQTKGIIIFSLFFILALLAMAKSAEAANYYVRQDAMGSNNGSDWTNAYQTLPPTLVRGATYYVADGTYPGYKFDDPVDGTKYITVKKATINEHGSETGWYNAYGDGVAIFRNDLVLGTSGGTTMYTSMALLQDYYDIDGVTGGGPASWKTGHGFKITLANGVSDGITIGDKYSSLGVGTRSMRNLNLSHIEVDGGVNPPPPGYGTGISASSGSGSLTTTDVILSHLYIHHVGGLHISFKIHPSNIIIQYSRLDANNSNPTNHGACVRIDNAHDITFRWNNISNIVGSTWIGHYGSDSDESWDADNFLVYGNIFHCETAVNVCGGSPAIIAALSTYSLPSVEGFRVYNNTFYNLRSMGTPEATQDVNRIVNVETDGGGNVFKNNLMYGFMNTELSTRSFGNISLDYNASDYNLSALDAHHQILSANPLVNATGGNFGLTSPTSPGVDLGGLFNKDMFGNTRGADGAWDRGAYEYVSGGSDSTPPAAPRNVKVQ